MQSLHDLSHFAIIFQKAQSHISMVFGQFPNNYMAVAYVNNMGGKDRAGEEGVVMTSGQRHLFESPAYPRHLQHRGGRCRVTNPVRPTGLDTLTCLPPD